MPDSTDGIPYCLDSAGFVLPGRRPPASAIRVAGRRGLDLAEHRSKVLTPELISEADVVLVMTSKQVRAVRNGYQVRSIIHLGDLEPGPIIRRDITDPLDHPEEVFHEVYDRIDRALDQLIELLRPPSPRRSKP